MDSGWRDDVLEFWFAELGPKDWFEGGEELDRRIIARFGALPDQLAANVPPEAGTDAKTALAAIIVFDQFPRNIFRRTAKAFAFDQLAAGLSRAAIDGRLDDVLDDAQRSFLYMPLMHSEVLADQERCVDLFRSLDNEGGLKYAIEHRDIIARFGRFPHRNKALGRESTPDELEFLLEHDGYGQ